MKKELHLFIVWSKAASKKEEIFSEIEKNFKVLEKYKITWSKDNYSQNLSRFYNKNLPKNSFKEKECGNGPFYLITVIDNKPKYRKRLTSRGDFEMVNVNTFDLKTRLRLLTGGGHKIHATDNIRETKQDLVLTLGQKYEEYIHTQPSNELKEIKRDVTGANGWESHKELFEVLNLTSNYVILRNFNKLENNEKHPDIDVLTDDLEKIVYLTNGQKVFDTKYRVLYKVKIKGKNTLFDFRYVGDGYYDEEWEKEILNTSIKHKYFYIPDKENYFYSLLYHALVHKKEFSKEYQEILTNLQDQHKITLGKNLLDKFLESKHYKYTEPKDLSVFYNYEITNEGITLRRRINNLRLKIRDKDIFILLKLILHRIKMLILVQRERRRENYKSLIWYIQNYRNFKQKLINEYEYKNIRPFRLLDWHYGFKYLLGSNAHFDLFIKIDSELNIIQNEIAVYKLLSKEKIINKHIPKLIDFNINDKDSYIVLEYIDGKPLSTLIKEKALTSYERNEIAKQLVALISKMNQLKLIHRDIRPENFLIEWNDNKPKVVIIDFTFTYSIDSDIKLIELSNTKKHISILTGLGFPYKPDKLRWDDFFSLKKILSELNARKQLIAKAKAKIGNCEYSY